MEHQCSAKERCFQADLACRASKPCPVPACNRTLSGVDNKVGLTTPVTPTNFALMPTIKCPNCGGTGWVDHSSDGPENIYACETCGGTNHWGKNIWGDPRLKSSKGSGRVSAKRVTLPCKSCGGSGLGPPGKLFPGMSPPNPPPTREKCFGCSGTGKGIEAFEFNGKYYVDLS